MNIILVLFSRSLLQLQSEINQPIARLDRVLRQQGYIKRNSIEEQNDLKELDCFSIISTKRIKMSLNVKFDYNFNEIPPLVDGDYKSTVKLTSYMQNDKRRVSMPPRDCSAVEVRRLRYLVGRGSKAKIILSGINMTVPEGAM